MPWHDMPEVNRKKLLIAQKSFEEWIENYLEIATQCLDDNCCLNNLPAAKFYAGQCEALTDCLRMLRIVGLLEWKHTRKQEGLEVGNAQVKEQ